MWASFRGLVAIPLLTKLVESRPLGLCTKADQRLLTCTCCHSRHVPSARAIKNLVCVWYFTPRHNYPKFFPVIQMSDDGEHWRDVQTKYLRYKPSETSWHWAPYHPRLDHYFYYTHFRAGDFKVSCLSGINPYYVHQIGFTEKLVEHLYRGNPLVQSLFENIPIAKPQYIRLATYGFKLEIPSHFKKTGNFWKRQLMGATKPLQRLDLDASTGIHPTYQPFIFDSLERDDEGRAFYEVDSKQFLMQREPLVVREEPEDTAESLHYKFPNHEYGGV